MVDLTMLQVARDLVAIFGVIAGFTYYVMTVRNQNKTRQVQLFMQIYMRYIESDLFGENYFTLMAREWESLDDYHEKYGVVDRGSKFPDGGNLNRMMTFFEGIAVLLQRNLIDIDLVYQLMPTNITALWGKYGDLVKAFRKGPYPPNLYRLVEDLSVLITDYAEKKGDPVITNYA